MVFAFENIGPEILSEGDIALLKIKGIDIDKYKDQDSYLFQSFYFGILSASIKDEKTKGLSYSDFKKYLNSAGFIPLTEQERNTLDALKKMTYEDINGLRNKIEKDVYGNLINQDYKDSLKEIISQETQKSVENRRSIVDTKLAILEKSKEYGRDFDRIIDYRMHQAFDTGRAISIAKDNPDAKCYKDVYMGACKHCIDLYLTDGIGSEPKIFKVSELVSNGTNIGRKTKDWKPVIGPTHPYCRCTLRKILANTIWDKNKKKYVFGDYKPSSKRKSRVEVEINGVKTLV